MHAQCVREVVMNSFTPLGLIYFWRYGCGDYYHLLAISVSDCCYHDQPFSSVMAWIRYSISFSSSRQSVICLYGAQTHDCTSPMTVKAFDIVVSEDQVLPSH